MPSIRLVGVDLASDPSNTAAVTFHIDDESVSMFVMRRVANSDIARWIEDPRTFVAIDAPLGWPSPFADAIRSWMFADRGWTPQTWLRPDGSRFEIDDDAQWQNLRELLKYRTTDRFVRHWRRTDHAAAQAAAGRHGVGCREKWPAGLSVSADRIAIATFRAAALLSNDAQPDA
ncbi:MAG TPA: DUF429 domain-containing protein, partial [Chloroflexota bacterium]|nr:DUF429 domain-containing protein [Chloroflexota bacterium]